MSVASPPKLEDSTYKRFLLGRHPCYVPAMSKPRLLIGPALALLVTACSSGREVPPAEETPALPPAPLALSPERSAEIRSGSIVRNDTIVSALSRLDVEIGKANEIVGALEGIFDFRRANIGDELRVVFEEGELQRFEYRRGPVEEYVVRNEEGRLAGSKREFQIEREVVRVAGTVETSLWDAITKAGEDPQIAIALADVLAWDVDFYMDPRGGDSFRIVIEKFTHEGKAVRYGDILAAEYDGSFSGNKRVFQYPNPQTGALEYYAENGGAARRAFLKTPLKFAFISSRFGSRVHPTLKYVKQHQGVDYAAATGTPVWAIGDGVVTRAGWGGACGNMVSLRHANGLETVYCHFSKIASGIRPGMKVAQKAVIGFVGMTGRATGPHLHFGVKRHGRFINPLSLKFPPADPLPSEELPAFAEAIAPMLEQLGDGKLASAEQDVGVVGP